MQSLSKYNKGIKYLLCEIDLFSKYAWVILIKDKKKCVTTVDAFQKILNDSNRSEAKSKGRKANKIWVDNRSEFYNNSFKNWLKDNDIEVYSIYNKGKSVVAERFVRTLKNKIFKHMTDILKKNVLDDVVNKYNTDVTDNTYVDSMELHLKKEVNDKDPKFKVGDDVRISKYKNIFATGYTPNWSKEVFIISKIENTVPWTYVINYLNGEEIIETFYEKELQRLIKKNSE